MRVWATAESLGSGAEAGRVHQVCDRACVWGSWSSGDTVLPHYVVVSYLTRKCYLCHREEQA
jgi:hypothetical protein